MSGIKIQINSLEALERLIGGDSELEIDIRNSVVQKFSKRHLKDIANKFISDGVIRSIKEELNNEYFDKSNYRHVKLTPEFQKILESSVDSHVRSLIKSRISERINSGELDEVIQGRVELEVSRHVGRITDSMIKKKAEELLIEKLKG